MYLTLALVVFFAAILVLFSQEFIRLFKRIFAVKGAKLLLPLAFASWFVYTFDYWGLWGIYYYREFLQTLVAFLMDLMPFHVGANAIATIILLTFISVAPVFLIKFILWKKHYKHYQYPYLTSTLIWLISAVLLLVVL